MQLVAQATNVKSRRGPAALGRLLLVAVACALLPLPKSVRAQEFLDDGFIQDLAPEPPVILPRVKIEPHQGTFRYAQDTPQAAPEQPSSSEPTSGVFPRQPNVDLFSATTSSLSDGLNLVPSGAPSAPSSSEVATNSSLAKFANDASELLHNSNSVQNVEVQRRSPVSLDPHIRGYKVGQIYTLADGAWWVPVRQDLDTFLNKVDPSLIQDIVVVPGPFGVQYGPGLSFIHLITDPTPRYQNGFEAHGRSGYNFRGNGSQLYGRQMLMCGNDNYGFRFTYGNRNGADYRSGNNSLIPATYLNQDFTGSYGFDINQYQHVEFGYSRLDQTNTEIPLQFFDINYLGTDAFNLSLVDESPEGPWNKLVMSGWNNRTRFDGNTNNKSNPNFPVMPRVEATIADNLGFPGEPVLLQGTTEGNVQSSGARMAATFGEDEDLRLTVGTDYRFLQQAISEQYTTNSSDPAVETAIIANGLSQFGTNQPNSFINDPGLFCELAVPLSTWWITSIGTRCDWVFTDARRNDIRPDSSLPGSLVPGDNLNQTDFLYAFYLTNKLELDENTTFRFGCGYSQRAPTLTERYADGLFLGILQSGFTRVIGDPTLDKERNIQLDTSLVGEYENFRGRLSFFSAWINDYITQFDDNVNLLTGARLLDYTNTDLATLIGGEMAGEFDLNEYFTPFGTLAYVDGRDRQIHAPLPQISPLDTRVGLRLHDAQVAHKWGMEFGTRMVYRQHRLGSLRLAGTDQATVVELPTAGFAVSYLRAYGNPFKNMQVYAGIENLFDKNYLEHLDLRLGPQAIGNFGPLATLAPGFTPYLGMELNY